MKLISKITAALVMLVTVTNIAYADVDPYYVADQYVIDDQGRQYLVPIEGSLKDRKMMELTFPISNGYYKIESAQDKTYGFDVSGGGDASNGKNLQLWTVNQNFEIFGNGDGYFRIKYCYSDRRKCITVADTTATGVVQAGSNLCVYEYSTGGTCEQRQLFKFKYNGDYTYTICSKYDENLVIGIAGGTMAKGTNIQLEEYTGSDTQKWKLNPKSTTYTLPNFARLNAMPDKYFVKYMIDKGYAKVYSHTSHSIVADRATLADNYDYTTGMAKCGGNEHVVVYPEEITELMGLGKYGNISTSKVENGVTILSFEGASNFKGIEYFTSLKKLDLSRAQYGDSLFTEGKRYDGNFIKVMPNGLNLKYNPELEYLNLDYARFSNGSDLEHSGIYGLKKLKFLNLSNNYLTDINLDKFPVLERFQAAHNFDLMSIKANTENTHMKELAIFDSMLGYEDGNSDNGALQRLINKFPKLVFLHAFATPTYNLDLTNHPYLESIWLPKLANGATDGKVYDGTYNIVNYKYRTYGMDCQQGWTTPGTNVGLWTINASSLHQQFKIEFVKTENDKDWYHIKPVHANGALSLDVESGKTEDNTNIKLWTADTGSTNNSQLFTFVRNNDGSYKIVTKLNGTSVLDISGGVISASNNIQLYHDNGTDAQKWVLIPQELSFDPAITRQIGKGPWLHNLDLSKCEKLRDVHVDNNHLASLKLNSPYIGQPFSTTEYQNWDFCKEVTGASVYGAAKLNPSVVVDNNYRHVNVNLLKQYNEKMRKWVWMFYLRLNYNGTNNAEANLVLDKQPSYFETLTLDNYGDYLTQGNMSRKEIAISNTLAGDDFDISRVKDFAFYQAVETDNVNSMGLMLHSKPGDNLGKRLCIISHDGNSEPIVDYGNADEDTKNILKNYFNNKVNGTIIVLKCGVSDSEPDVVPDDVPKSVMYGYDMNGLHNVSSSNAPARKVSAMEESENIGYFYLGLNYPASLKNPGIVTEVEELNVENKEVASVKYYNLAGIENDNPFVGINIMVVTYTDGTKTAAKVLK